MNKKTLIALILSLSSVANAAGLEGLSLGLGAGYQQKPFVGDNSDWVPVPHIEYKSGPFFIKGLKMGFDVMEFGNTTVDIHAQYQALNYKTSDAPWPYNGLNDRKSTVLLGAGIGHRFDNDIFINADLQGDILGHSNELNANAQLGYIYKMASNFTLVPAVNLQWDDKKHNRYYYGVSASESMLTGIPQYNPGASVTPSVALGFVAKATDRFHVFGGVEVEFLPSKVKNSPITDRSTLTNFALGVNYNF